MRKLFTFFTQAIIVSLFLGAIPTSASAAAFLVVQGGTGQTTFSQGILYSPGGTKAFATTATTSVTCSGNTSCNPFVVFGSSPITISSSGGSGSVTQINTTYPITGGPITTTGTLALAFGTTTANTWSALNIFSNASTTLATHGVTWFTSNTGAVLSTSASGLLQNTTVSSPLNFTGSTLSCSTCTTGGVTSVTGIYPIISSGGATPAISTAFGTTTSNVFAGTQTFTNAPIFSSLTGVLLGNGASALTAASTQTCTNQFFRSLSNVYAVTCASVSLTADVTGILPIANGGTNASSFTQSGGILAYDGTRAVNFSGYTLTSSLLTATNASTTNFTVNSTNVAGDGSGSDFITTTRALSVTYATSTAWTGSSTVLDIGIAPFNITLNTARCHTDAGTLNVQLQYGTGPTNAAMLFASSTIGQQTLSSNNTPAKGNDIAITFGTPASSPTQVNCTFSGPQTGI